MKKFIAFMLFGLFSFAVFTISASSTKAKANTELSQMTIIDVAQPYVETSNDLVVIISEQTFGFVQKEVAITKEVEARCNSPTEVQ